MNWASVGTKNLGTTEVFFTENQKHNYCCKNHNLRTLVSRKSHNTRMCVSKIIVYNTCTFVAKITTYVLTIPNKAM